MDGRRLRFYAALAVFILWVAALGVLAVRSGRRPPPPRGAGPSVRADRPSAGSPTADALVVDAGPAR